MKKLQDEIDAVVLACSFHPHYAGSQSDKFWQQINESGDPRLYELGLILQNIESRVLVEVNEEVEKIVREQLRKQRKNGKAG